MGIYWLGQSEWYWFQKAIRKQVCLVREASVEYTKPPRPWPGARCMPLPSDDHIQDLMPTAGSISELSCSKGRRIKKILSAIWSGSNSWLQRGPSRRECGDLCTWPLQFRLTSAVSSDLGCPGSTHPLSESFCICVCCRPGACDSNTDLWEYLANAGENSKWFSTTMSPVVRRQGEDTHHKCRFSGTSVLLILTGPCRSQRVGIFKQYSRVFDTPSPYAGWETSLQVPSKGNLFRQNLPGTECSSFKSCSVQLMGFSTKFPFHFCMNKISLWELCFKIFPPWKLKKHQ